MNNLLSFFSNYWLEFILSIAVGYILGSISFAIIFTRIFEHKDIRSEGSGNAGFTNTLRCASRKAAILTLVCDFAKGILAVLIGSLIFEYLGSGVTPFIMVHIGAYIAGFACLIGHLKPIFFGFKGGKGVLTSSAIMLMIDWRVFLIGIGVFLLILLFSGIISLSSICAAASLPIGAFVVSYFIDYMSFLSAVDSDYTLTYVLISTFMALLFSVVIIFMHRSNVERLRNGTEKKIKPKPKT